MDAEYVYDLLHTACRMLDQSGDTAIAAHVSHCMAMVSDLYGVGADRLDAID